MQSAPILQVVPPRAARVAGHPIRRLLPARERRMVGPFIFMDQGGPSPVPPGPGGVPEHPHAGLSTFTYLMDGEMNHRDSAGHTATVRSGDIALMTAGRGITHEELSDGPAPGEQRSMFFAQMWLALPDALEEMPPAFEQHGAGTLPIITAESARVRLAMGSMWGKTAPTTCHAPTIFAELQIEPGGALTVPQAYDEQAIMIIQGDARIDEVPLSLHALNLVAPRDVVLRSTAGCRALLIGGAHFPTRRYIGGPFVASSMAKLKRWMQDSAAGRWPKIQR